MFSRVDSVNDIPDYNVSWVSMSPRWKRARKFQPMIASFPHGFSLGFSSVRTETSSLQRFTFLFSIDMNLSIIWNKFKLPDRINWEITLRKGNKKKTSFILPFKDNA